MDSLRRDHDTAHPYDGTDDARSPMLRPMSAVNMGSIVMCIIVGMLAACWCILDYWNRQISQDLFSIGSLRTMDIDDSGAPKVLQPFSNFDYPITLAFLQFAFMAIFFLAMHFSVNQRGVHDLVAVKITSDRRWPVMVVSHVFSTFWLQTLMMPAQALPVSLFAASRACEIPVAAGLRSQVLGARAGKKNSMTIGLAFASACLMFFSYARMSGCACVWSGAGVALSGVSFWIISMMMLAMPAANAVCQEAVMLQPGMHPLLLLALQNILACIVFAPVLAICHLMGWEDVGGACAMIVTYSEVFMLVLWLCAQMTATSLLCITLIHMTDSFWAITLRALRVVFWAISMITSYYIATPGVPVSISCPMTSLWGFVLMMGGLMGAIAAYHDHFYIMPEEIAVKNEAVPAVGKNAQSTSSSIHC